jgi:arylamine N-acetyltransferase
MARGASRIVGVRLPETLDMADVGLGSAPLTHPTSLRGVSEVEPRSSVVRKSTTTYFK